MAEEQTITAEMLAVNPEWVESGLKVGDPVPLPVATPPRGGQRGKEESEKVTVDREMLENILKEVQGLRDVGAEVERLKKDNEMLLSVADKSRIANYQSRNNPAGLIRSARVWYWKDKIVKATVTLRNDVFTDNAGRVHTDQVLKVVLEDGSEDEVSYDKFAKEKVLVEADIVKRETNDENGQTFYTMKLKDGKTIAINYLFLN